MEIKKLLREVFIITKGCFNMVLRVLNKLKSSGKWNDLDIETKKAKIFRIRAIGHYWKRQHP